MMEVLPERVMVWPLMVADVDSSCQNPWLLSISA
jgi:hypothetical protein